jgi:hypothetical protein
VHDQSARDPRWPRATQLVQPCRPRPRRPRQGCLDRRRLQAPVRMHICVYMTNADRMIPNSHPVFLQRPIARPDHRCHLSSMGRRPIPPDIPTRAQHGFAQIMGRRRRVLACSKPRLPRQARRARPALGAERQDVGLLRRALQGPPVRVSASLRLLRDGERALQDLIPSRVPRADGRRGRAHRA